MRTTKISFFFLIIYNLIRMYSYIFFIRRRKEILLLFNSAAEGYGPQNILLLLGENKKENILLLLFCSRERQRICREHPFNKNIFFYCVSERYCPPKVIRLGRKKKQFLLHPSYVKQKMGRKTLYLFFLSLKEKGEGWKIIYNIYSPERQGIATILSSSLKNKKYSFYCTLPVSNRK